MKINKSKLLVLFVFVLVFSLVGCSGNGSSDFEDKTDAGEANNVASPYEDYFEWDENIIVALTDLGAKQKSIVIPERCEGFDGMIFADRENKVESVSFQSEKDIDLNCVFSCAEQLRTIKLPKQLTKIENLEFWLCYALEEITIPSAVTSIGSYAFQDNKSLKKIVFGGELESIGAHAFEGCVELSSIELPSSVSTIEKYSFYGCSALETVTLPASLKAVGEFAFANNGLLYITVPADLQLDSYTTTSFVQADHAVNVHVTEGSWIDEYFDFVFDGAYTKIYD